MSRAETFVTPYDLVTHVSSMTNISGAGIIQAKLQAPLFNEETDCDWCGLTIEKNMPGK